MRPPRHAIVGIQGVFTISSRSEPKGTVEIKFSVASIQPILASPVLGAPTPACGVQGIAVSPLAIHNLVVMETVLRADGCVAAGASMPSGTIAAAQVPCTPVKPTTPTTTATTTATTTIPAYTHASPSNVVLPRLHEGKTIPGPAEWRALEQRASSFRLRGSGGCIGRPGER